ncbi:MAG: histidine kinase [Gemmatimonadaceae bacterium]
MAASVLLLVVVGFVIRQQEVAPFSPGTRPMMRIPPAPTDLTSLLLRLGVGSVAWYACAVAWPAFWYAAARSPLGDRPTWRALATPVLLLLGLIAATCIAHYLVEYRGSPLAPSFVEFLPVALAADAAPLLAVAAVVNVVESRRRAVRMVLESERLRAELAESQLAAVTVQLQPHFLFNTLQSISTLIHRDPAAADAMLTQLSDLLREVLRRSTSALVPLDDELRMAETYLALARIRFAERLTIRLDIDDAARRAQVPVLLLQPLLENALRHGIGPRAAGGRVGVTARVQTSQLHLTVWDDGVGLPATVREGTGLGNTRERLRYAFGTAHSMDVRPGAAGGVEVSVHLPMRLAAEAHA